MYTLTFGETMGIRERISAAVNASGSAAFNAIHQQLPPNWNDVADAITNKVMNQLPDVLKVALPPILERHAKETAAKEKTPTKRMKKIGIFVLGGLFMLFVGVLFRPYFELIWRLILGQ